MKKIISVILSICLITVLAITVFAQNDIVFSLNSDNSDSIFYRGNTYTIVCNVDSAGKGVAAGSFIISLGDGIELLESGFFEDPDINFSGDFTKIEYGENAGKFANIFLSMNDSSITKGRFCYFKIKISDNAPNKTIIKFFGNDLCNQDLENVTTNVSELILTVENNHADINKETNEENVDYENDVVIPENTPVEIDSKDDNVLSFIDVPDTYWAYPYITDLASRKIVNGIGNNKFAPERSVTRAEFVKLLAGLAEINTEAYHTDMFTDVNEKDWFMPYVAWAVDNGISTGTTNTTFSPNLPVTREQAATLLYRLCVNYSIDLDVKNSKIDFSDSNLISSYAVEAINSMQMAGIINGVGNNMFNPKGNTTRAAACKMISLLIK